MPIVTKQRKKQQKLIYAAIGVVGITGLVFYFGILGKGLPGIAFKKDEFLPVRIIQKIPKVDLDTNLLSDERFLKLTPYETLPTTVQTGRKNPFLPY